MGELIAAVGEPLGVTMRSRAIWGPLPGHWVRYAQFHWREAKAVAGKSARFLFGSSYGGTTYGEENWNQGLLCVLWVLCVHEA